MATTNFSPQMLAKLESAIASGVKEVYYGDKRVSYQSLDDMIRARDLMRKELGLINSSPRKVLPSHSKGL